MSDTRPARFYSDTSLNNVARPSLGYFLVLFMVIERFRDHNARPVHERAAERARMAPDGLVSAVRPLEG